MTFITHQIAAWLNRQYRMTFRAALNGLLASGMHGDDVIARAHELTVASLKQFKSVEIPS